MMLISPAVRKVEGSLPFIYDLATEDNLRYPSRPHGYRVARRRGQFGPPTTLSSPLLLLVMRFMTPATQEVGVFYIVPYDPLPD